MRINFHGRLENQPEIKAGFIGCGSHSFRNIYPTFQFAPIKLLATCDLDLAKAQAFAEKFGAKKSFSDYHEMLKDQEIEAVFIVTGYDDLGRPLYPKIAIDCLAAGKHVWMEKPPAQSTKEIEEIQAAAAKVGKNVMVGLKKMFFPANEKAKELASSADFGKISLGLYQYPQHIPTQAEFDACRSQNRINSSVLGFLDHLCHPAALLVYMQGMPSSLYFERSSSGAGTALFGFENGASANLAFTAGSARNAGMERTTLISDKGKHVLIDNNIRLSYHQDAFNGYGDVTNAFGGNSGDTTAFWEPEFSLGQLYNKGLFLLGYYGEVNEFAKSILERRPPAKGTLEQAWQVTRIFEAFFEGPRKLIFLPQTPPSGR
jgi:predicted dehydrogenase